MVAVFLGCNFIGQLQLLNLPRHLGKFAMVQNGVSAMPAVAHSERVDHCRKKNSTFRRNRKSCLLQRLG